MRRTAYILVATLLVLACSLSSTGTSGTPSGATPPTLAPATRSAGPPVTQPATATPAATAAPATRTAMPRRTRGAPRPNSVDNGNILLQLSASVNGGVAIADICDEQANVDYVSPDCSGSTSIPLFEFGLTGSAKTYPSDTGLTVTAAHPNAGGSLTIMATAKDVPLSFTLDVAAPAGEPAAIIRLKAKNTSQKQIYLRVDLPKLDGLQNTK